MQLLMLANLDNKDLWNKENDKNDESNNVNNYYFPKASYKILSSLGNNTNTLFYLSNRNSNTRHF